MRNWLDSCFASPRNEPRRDPIAKPLPERPSGSGFEARAFAALMDHADALGIAEVHRCHAARVDGFLKMCDGEYVIVEMKERLAWPTVQSAAFEFLAGGAILQRRYPETHFDFRRALIVFERIDEGWNTIPPHGAWGQLALHASELSGYLQIGGLQVKHDGSLHTSLGTVASAVSQ